MTNADKLLRDGVKIDDFENIYHDWLIKDMVLESEREIQLNKLDSVMRFLREPCKPTLSEDERVILMNIDKKYKFIYRDKYSDLNLDYSKPTKDDINCKYAESIFNHFDVYNHLFQFIKERRRILY